MLFNYSKISKQITLVYFYFTFRLPVRHGEGQLRINPGPGAGRDHFVDLLERLFDGVRPAVDDSEGGMVGLLLFSGAIDLDASGFDRRLDGADVVHHFVIAFFIEEDADGVVRNGPVAVGVVDPTRSEATS